jgi:deoxyribose-phosphate aldolase
MNISDRLEQTLLRPDSMEEEVRLACMGAKSHNLAALALPPVWARFAAIALAGSPVRLDVLVGYPLGTHTPSVKGLEARLALEEGAAEITFVPNLAAYKTGYRETFSQDVAYTLKQCRLVNPDAVVKVLLYLDLLSQAEQREVVRLVQENGGRFLMLASFENSPVPPATVRRIQALVAERTQLGVFGNIRSWNEAAPFIELDIVRLATPFAQEIAKEAASLS